MVPRRPRDRTSLTVEFLFALVRMAFSRAAEHVCRPRQDSPERRNTRFRQGPPASERLRNHALTRSRAELAAATAAHNGYERSRDARSRRRDVEREPRIHAAPRAARGIRGLRSSARGASTATRSVRGAHGHRQQSRRNAVRGLRDSWNLAREFRRDDRRSRETRARAARVVAGGPALEGAGTDAGGPTRARARRGAAARSRDASLRGDSDQAAASSCCGCSAGSPNGG